MPRCCYQVNLQKTFGGGEVFTRFFSDALVSIGWSVVLFVHEAATFWSGMDIREIRIVRISEEEDIWKNLPPDPALVVTHTALSEAFAHRISERHRLVGLVHMPLYERNPAGFRYYHNLLGVSRHVIASVLAKGYVSMYPDPLYGVADLKPRAVGVGYLRERSCYDWDRRKVRDRVLGTIEPWVEPFRRRREFVRKTGLSIGVVSRLTPIKQFPEMFSITAAIFGRHSTVNLEVFGAGGYGTVRDLKESLALMGDRVRYWGHQPDVASVYPVLDYVLSGLPEKEAMGLNLIEAQMAGTAVLAVDAPPFSETVLANETGYMFRDPRRDRGASFDSMLGRIVSGKLPRLDPRKATEHLDRFSERSFRIRVQTAFDRLGF